MHKAIRKLSIGELGALRAEGEVTGDVTPTGPTPIFPRDEFIHDARGFITVVRDWRR